MLQSSFFKDSVSFGGGFSTYGINALKDNGNLDLAKDLNLKLNNVLEGRTSIYEFQSSLLEKTQKSETENLKRQIDYNRDLIDLERIRLKGQISSNIVTLQSNRATLLNQARNAPQDVSDSLNSQANAIGKTIEDWQKTLALPENELNNYFDKNSVSIKGYNSAIQETTESLNQLGISQAGVKQELFSSSTEGLKQLYEAIKSGSKDNVIKDIEERKFWQERVGLIAENKALELEFYKDSTFLAEQRKNKLLGYVREVFELRNELADKSLFSQNESDAKVLGYLNSQIKSSSEILADFKIGIGESFFDAINSPFDALSKKLEGLPPLVRGLAQSFLDLGNDIVKAFSKKIIMQLLGLGDSSGGSKGSGGGFWNIIKNIIGGGSSNRGAGGPGSATGGGNSLLHELTHGFGGSGGGLHELGHLGGAGGSSGFSSIFGDKGFGNNTGTYSALGAGVSILGSLIGGRTGGFISGAGAGLGMGASIGTMIMPGLGTAIGAGVGALAGGLMSLLGGDPKRKKDKKENLPALNKFFIDAMADFQQLLKDSNALKIEPPESALTKGLDIRNQIAAGGGIKFESKKYQKEAQSLIAAQLLAIDKQPDGLMQQLIISLNRAKSASETRKRLGAAEFATGTLLDDSFRNQYEDFKRMNGMLQGQWTGRDELPALLAKGEMVLNPRQIQSVIDVSGFDPFKYAYPKIPKYADGGYIAPAQMSQSPANQPKQPIVINIYSTNNGMTESYIRTEVENSMTEEVVVNLYERGKVRRMGHPKVASLFTKL